MNKERNAAVAAAAAVASASAASNMPNASSSGSYFTYFLLQTSVSGFSRARALRRIYNVVIWQLFLKM